VRPRETSQSNASTAEPAARDTGLQPPALAE
jgi:hypothetical protein